MGGKILQKQKQYFSRVLPSVRLSGCLQLSTEHQRQTHMGRSIKKKHICGIFQQSHMEPMPKSGRQTDGTHRSNPLDGMVIPHSKAFPLISYSCCGKIPAPPPTLQIIKSAEINQWQTHQQGKSQQCEAVICNATSHTSTGLIPRCSTSHPAPH